MQKGTREVNGTGLLFDVEDPVLARSARPVPTPVVSGSEAELTPVAGVALWGPLLDRLNVVAEADRRGLRPVDPGGYSGGACYRALVETLLAGGDFLSDRALLADPAGLDHTARRFRYAHAHSFSSLWLRSATADPRTIPPAGAKERDKHHSRVVP